MQKKTSSRNPIQKKSRKQRNQEIERIYEELGNYAQTNWGREWVNSILEYGRPYRMQRGVRYALEDRIENLSISPGMIFATVQGTAPTPYRVKVQFPVIPEEGWKKIIEHTASKAIYLIKLLENKMPDDILDIFDKSGYPLFPPAAEEMTADCSCPDKEIPCKHIAATVLYIARVIDFDPFLLLKLRGKSKEDLMKELSFVRSCENRPIVQATKSIRQQVNIADFTFEEIPNLILKDISIENFLNSSEPMKIGFRFKPIGSSIETIDTLGVVPNAQNSDQFNSILREIYLTTTKNAYAFASELERKKNTEEG